MEFSQVIKSIMEAHNLSKTQFLRVCGLSYRAADKWDHLKRGPHLDTIKKIESALNVVFTYKDGVIVGWKSAGELSYESLWSVAKRHIDRLREELYARQQSEEWSSMPDEERVEIERRYKELILRLEQIEDDAQAQVRRELRNFETEMLHVSREKDAKDFISRS